MDHKINISGWAAEWLNRTHEGLMCEASGFLFLVAIVVLPMVGMALASVMKCRRALKEDPTNRAAIIARSDRFCLKVNQGQFCVAQALLLHALGIWIIDAGIMVFAITEDAKANPGSYDTRSILELAIHVVSMSAIFLAVFIFFPMLQMLAAGSLFARMYTSSGSRLANVLPALRTFSCHIATLWSLVAFYTVVVDGPLENTTIRLILLQAIVGSSSAWLHTSYVFIFRGEQLAELETQPSGVADGIKLYGKQVHAMYFGEKEAGLPRYSGETKPLVSEQGSN